MSKVAQTIAVIGIAMGVAWTPIRSAAQLAPGGRTVGSGRCFLGVNGGNCIALQSFDSLRNALCLTVDCVSGCSGSGNIRFSRGGTRVASRQLLGDTTVCGKFDDVLIECYGFSCDVHYRVDVLK